jgi:pimeloyl-ACP methyl ester carboxylesterase
MIPGFWLTAESWEPITGELKNAGHEPIVLTLPGMASLSDDRSEIGLRDHVNAVIDVIDRNEGSVVLLGHSAGGALAHAAADARPDRVTRVIYVDSIPLGDGECVNTDLPVVDGEIPLPDWSVFDPEDLVDLDEELRAMFRARAIPVPARVASDSQILSDPRRYDVATTIIACEFSSAQITQWIDEGHSWMAELGAMKDVTYIDVPTGHWPQFTKPAELAAAITAALRSPS